jgi:hypothetical protein
MSSLSSVVGVPKAMEAIFVSHSEITFSGILATNDPNILWNALLHSVSSISSPAIFLASRTQTAAIFGLLDTKSKSGTAVYEH